MTDRDRQAWAPPEQAAPHRTYYAPGPPLPWQDEALPRPGGYVGPPPARRTGAVIAVAVTAVVLVAGALGWGALALLGGRAGHVAEAAPGYPVLHGPSGRSIAVGRPWGSACTPVLFVLGPDAGRDFSSAFRAVVVEAQAGGLRVGVTGPGIAADDPQLTALGAVPSATVPVAPSSALRRKPDGTAYRVSVGWDTAVDADGTHDHLVQFVANTYPAQIGTDAVLMRKVARMVVAEAEGLREGTTSGTGIAAHLENSRDAFSTPDLAAIRAMSGCAAPSR